MKNVTMLSVKSYSLQTAINADCFNLACPEYGRGYRSFSTKRSRKLKDGVITFDTI